MTSLPQTAADAVTAPSARAEDTAAHTMGAGPAADASCASDRATSARPVADGPGGADANADSTNADSGADSTNADSVDAAIIDADSTDADTAPLPALTRANRRRRAPRLAEVVAIVIGSTPQRLTGALDALAAGSALPAHLLLVLAPGADELAEVVSTHPLRERLETARVLTVKGELSLAHAVDAALRRDDGLLAPGVTTAWLLTDDARPARTALDLLHTALGASRGTAVAAPKVRAGQDRPELVSVGYVLTRAGRWVPQPAPGERDQGQYDDRTDVLATSSVGALVDLALLREVGAWAPSLQAGPLGLAADVDLGWRLHRSGSRVLLVSAATVDVDPDGAGAHAAAVTPASRRTLRALALGAAPLLLWPVRLIGVLATAVLSLVIMLLAKRPRAAWRELTDGLAVLRLDRAWSAHRRFARTSRVPRRALSQLFVAHESARTATLDDLIPERRGRGILSQQDLALRGARPQVVVHPALLAVLAVVAMTIVAGRDVGGSMLRRLGWGVSGGEVVGSGASAASLWRAARDSWAGPGLGAPDSVWGPALAVLSVVTGTIERLPFLDPPSAPAAAATGALLIITLPLAALAAYAALALITPRRSLRALGALAWAGTGIAATSIAQGRLGAAVVLVMLPLAAAALGRALGRGGRSFDAAQAGLALVLIGAFAPMVAVFVAAAGLLVGLLPKLSLRRALGAALVPLLVLAPFVRRFIAEPQQALGGIGLFDWSGTLPDPWRLALLQTSAEPLSALASGELAQALLIVPVLALALVGLARGRRRLETLAAAVVGAAALAGALVLSRITVDSVPVGWTGAGAPIRPWAGTLALVYALVVVALAVRGLDVLARGVLRRPRLAWLAPTAGVLAVGALVVGTAWVGLGSTLTTYEDNRPAVAVDHAEGPLAGRSLLIDRLTVEQGAEAATAYRVVGAEGGLPVRTLPEPTTASAGLGAVVSRIDVGGLENLGDEVAGGAAAVLARHAIGFVAVSEELPTEAIRSLDATEGLRRLPDRPGLFWWRVDATTSDVPSPARLVLRAEDGDGVTIASRHHAQVRTTVTGAGVLEVAEVPQWAETATVRLDEEVLEPREVAGVLTYEVPAAGTLTIAQERTDDGLTLLGIAALGVSAFLALPFGGASSATLRARRGGDS
ncbi:MAG: hypothetical protein Q4G67_11915 [Actinomycetia bacterium]|nr:hypothetical protein [Actinomycetes bacterium]